MTPKEPKISECQGYFPISIFTNFVEIAVVPNKIPVRAAVTPANASVMINAERTTQSTVIAPASSFMNVYMGTM
jgi:hypothetical protein